MGVFDIASLIGGSITDDAEGKLTDLSISDLGPGIDKIILLLKYVEKYGAIFSNQAFLNAFAQEIQEIKQLPTQDRYQLFSDLCERHTADIMACAVTPQITLREQEAHEFDTTTLVAHATEQLYNDIASRLQHKANIVICGEQHTVPAIHLAKRIVLTVAKERGFSCIVVEFSKEQYEVGFNTAELEMKSKIPILVHSETVEGRVLRMDGKELKHTIDTINWANFFIHAKQLGYTIIPGDHSEKTTRERNYRKNPTPATREQYIDARNTSMATAVETDDSYIIFVGASHERGIHDILEKKGKAVYVLDFQSLSLIPQTNTNIQIRAESMIAENKHPKEIEELKTTLRLAKIQSELGQEDLAFSSKPEYSIGHFDDATKSSLNTLTPGEIDTNVKAGHARWIEHRTVLEKSAQLDIADRPRFRNRSSSYTNAIANGLIAIENTKDNKIVENAGNVLNAAEVTLESSEQNAVSAQRTKGIKKTPENKKSDSKSSSL